jgi:hypothetical protein
VDAHVNQLKRDHAKKLRSNKKLTATTVDHDLNYGVVLPTFIGEMRVTDNESLVNVVFDTASDWLVVPDRNCVNCVGAKVDNSGALKTSSQQSDRRYASATLKGDTYKNKVCLGSSRSSCVEDFEYFAFSSQAGIEFPIEGILGMSQNKQMRLSTEEMQIGPLFVNELFQADNIP